jgi:hypothetical protein
VKLFTIVPGFGAPETGTKERILRGNLAVLRAAWPSLHVRVCCYEANYAFPPDIAAQIDSIHEPGVVGQFLLKYAHPEEVAAHGATHVAIVLDDVELLPGLDFEVMLTVLAKLAGHVASPVLTTDRPSPWAYINHRPQEPPGTAIRAGACEMFFMLMPLAGYARYYSGLDWRNPWCWGVDLSMQARGLQAVLFNDMQVRHWFSGSGDAAGTARTDEVAYFTRRGWTKEGTVQALRFERFTYRREEPPEAGGR